MNLEQLRQSLDTDARKRCEAQEKTIKELHAKVKAQQGIITALQNRCFVQTRGMLCLFCGKEVRETCKRYNDKQKGGKENE